MKIKKWTEDLVKDVYQKYKKNYTFWKPGLKIFYSPISINPKITIIGFQPGGGAINYINEDKDNFESGDFSLPKVNEFFQTEYKFAKRMRDLFSFDGGTELLKTSNVFPLVFFRASSVSTWNKEIPKNVRLEMEELCISKIDEILKKTNPEKILILGLETYSRFKKSFGPARNEKIIYKRSVNNSKMVISSMVGKYSILAIIHPTGSRISNIDWSSIKSLFHSWMLGDKLAPDASVW